MICDEEPLPSRHYLNVIEKSAYDKLVAILKLRDELACAALDDAMALRRERDQLKARLAEMEALLKDCIAGHDVSDYLAKTTHKNSIYMPSQNSTKDMPISTESKLGYFAED